MTETRKFQRASASQVVAIHQKLTEVLTEVGDKLFVYEDGWSDAKVAEAVDPDGILKGTHVKNVRYDTFGNLARAREAEELALADRVSVLEERVAVLTDQVAQLVANPARPLIFGTSDELIENT